MSAIDWLWFVAWLGCELLFVAAIAALLQVCFRSAQTQRRVWQAAFTCMGLIMIVELSGAREKLPRPDWRPHHHFSLTAGVEPATAQDAPKLRTADAQIATEPKAVSRTVTWPGRVWLAGLILLLTRSFAPRIWLGLRRRAALPADAETLRLIAQLQTSVGLSGVRALSWTGLRGPVAFGIFQPTIALPRDFSERFSVGERHAMLAHEMAHLGGRDPFWFLMSDVVIALAWWHPIVWWARRRLHLASEVCADEASALVPGGSCALAECLVRFGRELTGSGPARSLGAGGNGLKSQLAIRIARLLRGEAASRPVSAWARCLPQFSAVIFATTSAILPIQTGLSGSVLGALMAYAPVRAETPAPVITPATTTNQAPINASAQAVDSRLVTSDPPITEPGVPIGKNEFGGSALVPTASQPPINLDDSASASSNHPATNLHQILARINDGRAPVGKAADEARAESNSAGKLQPKVCLLIKAVLLTERDSDGLGLDWLFGAAPTNGSPLETSHDWNALQGGNYGSLSQLTLNFGSLSHLTLNPVTNDHPRSVTVDILPSGKSAILSREQFAALIKRIETATHDDVLAAPKVTTLSGRQAHVATQDLKEIVTGVEAKVDSANNAGVSYFTDQVPTGFTVDIIPKAEDNDAWHLIVVARYLTFQGYDKPAHEPSYSARGGKPMKYHQPLPHFRVLEADAESTMSFGQTMAIRGPLTTETIKTKGSFFVRAKTKTIRQRFYVFVTPTRVP